MAHIAVYANATAEPLALKKSQTIYHIPDLKLCPNLKADLTLTKGANGLVTILGKVTNVGQGSCNVASVAEVIMNLAYAPQYSYVMTGVSQNLAAKPFTTLKVGASFTVNTSYQIPDFGGWATAGVQVNAKRLFSLHVIKQDGSIYNSGEECDPENNAVSRELAYRDLKH
jgi:hypothetical protein